MENYNWERYQKYLFKDESLGLSLDYSCFAFSSEYFAEMENKIKKALVQMRELENGALANPSEKRQVGHYWLRNPALAPQLEMTKAIEQTYLQVKKFAQAIRTGEVLSPTGHIFSRFLLIGIGGSALGPQLITDVFPQQGLQPHFLDNTDPETMISLLTKLKDYLRETLVIVISKSGGTIETRNGLMVVRNFFAEQSLDFAGQVVAITGPGSKLEKQALEEKWLACFHIWDWVGGRTSLTSAVGLLPAFLSAVDGEDLLKGARDCDLVTRRTDISQNPAAIMALMWYYAVEKKQKRNMVVLPYRDRLQTLPRYLQQLVMESLGKEKDLTGQTVNQGLTVYGNKGSTDQHAYVQQLLEGKDDFFVVFLEVIQSEYQPLFIEEDLTCGDYLKAFLEGTRQALLQKGRESLTLSLKELTPYSLGVLVALWERVVGLYAYLLNLNAYDQPGVELGKKSAHQYVTLQKKVLQFLRTHQGKYSPQEIAANLKVPTEIEFIYKILEQLYQNQYLGIKKEKGTSSFADKYYL